jgi:hypothetical protein
MQGFPVENRFLGEPHLQHGSEMGRRLAEGSKERFAAYVRGISERYWPRGSSRPA